MLSVRVGAAVRAGRGTRDEQCTACASSQDARCLPFLELASACRQPAEYRAEDDRGASPYLIVCDCALSELGSELRERGRSAVEHYIGTSLDPTRHHSRTAHPLGQRHTCGPALCLLSLLAPPPQRPRVPAGLPRARRALPLSAVCRLSCAQLYGGCELRRAGVW